MHILMHTYKSVDDRYIRAYHRSGILAIIVVKKEKKMKIYLDTDNYESISIKLTEEEEEKSAAELLPEFYYAMSALFIDFTKVHLDLDVELIKKLYASHVGGDMLKQYVNDMLDELIAEDGEDEGISEEERNELREQMLEEGFSEEEIESIMEFLDSYSSMEEATEALSAIAKQHNLDS